jgi:hypothetical protein
MFRLEDLFVLAVVDGDAEFDAAACRRIEIVFGGGADFGFEFRASSARNTRRNS